MLNNRGLRTVEAMQRRMRILDLLKEKPMSTKQIFKVINDNFGRISEDIIRLQKWGYIERSPIKIYCELGERASWFYSRTEKAYEGYEYLQKVSKEIDLEKALDEHKARARIQREGLRDKEGKEVYIKVPGNPNATIVMNSNRPAGFYSYQKRRPSVNRGIGSSFSMFEGATDGL
jgi:hypothetical protein